MAIFFSLAFASVPLALVSPVSATTCLSPDQDILPPCKCFGDGSIGVVGCQQSLLSPVGLPFGGVGRENVLIETRTKSLQH